VVDATPEEEVAYLKERGMLNVEIKARCAKELHAEFEKTVLGRGGEFHGCDHQIDTYFNVPMGRLKLREGNIENFLVQYSRPDQAGPKISQFRLVKNPKDSGLKEALTAALGVLAVVDKWRDIYWIGNVKIHFDSVDSLGTFVEIEAQDKDGTMTVDRLREQTDELIAAFGIKPEDLISESYSDMILKGV
jgi:predicted adenylyl cyclase CyaB